VRQICDIRKKVNVLSSKVFMCLFYGRDVPCMEHVPRVDHH